MGCHAIWTWRNTKEHERGFLKLYDPGTWILQRIKEYEDATGLNKEVKNQGRSVKMIGWTPSDSNMVKLNTNGACKDGITTGYIGLIRQSNGNWINEFAKSLGYCSVVMVKLWGVFEGLKLIEEIGLRRIVINVDSIDGSCY